MRGFAVHRYGGNNFMSPGHHMSLISPETLSVIETVDVPFDRTASVYTGSCGRFLYFIAGIGEIVIWKVPTEEIIKELPPPVFLPSSRGHRGQVLSIGLGYDATSADYKVVRYFVQHYAIEQGGSVVPSDYYFDLYSLKRGKYKMLKRPFAEFNPLDVVGVYAAAGCCYWRAWDRVLSFDFVSETFDQFSLPPSSDPEACYKLAEFHGALAALVYIPPELSSKSLMTVDIFIWFREQWGMIYSVPFNDVRRPVGLTNDYLFLEAKNGNTGTSCLMAYNLVAGKSKKLNIFDFKGTMDGVSYNETPDPHPTPVTTMISPSKEEEEKEKQKEKQREQKKKKKQERERVKEEHELARDG